MHKQLAADGFELITVSLDHLDDEDPKVNAATLKRVESFLKEQGAPGINLLMTEDADFNYEKMGFRGTPCIFVFDRQGKWTRFVSDKMPFKDEDVEQLVKKLLKEKTK